MSPRTKTREERRRAIRAGVWIAVTRVACSGCDGVIVPGDFVLIGGEDGWRHARCGDVDRQRERIRAEARRRDCSPVRAARRLLEEGRG